MTMDLFTEFIKSVGFPVFIATYLLTRIEPQLKQQNKTLVELNDTIKNSNDLLYHIALDDDAKEELHRKERQKSTMESRQNAENKPVDELNLPSEAGDRNVSEAMSFSLFR